MQKPNGLQEIKIKRTMSDKVLKITDLHLGYDGKPIVFDINLSVHDGEFISLLGPSGCGKTTILRAIAGFLPAMSGNISLHGKDITNTSAEQRDIGIVFQNYALFPTMSAFENIAFGLRATGATKRDIDDKVFKIAELSGLKDHLLKKPKDLSGGQQQRVAIARAMVTGSSVLLFDEPLSNLDAKVRMTMRREIKRLQKELGFTAILVTHDQEEALSMSDRILVMNAGYAEQVGTPLELYQTPQTPFIANFIGQANELNQRAADALIGQTIGRVFVKYEDVLIGDHGPLAEVTHVEFLGPQTRVDLNFEGEEISALIFGFDAPKIGEKVHISVRDSSQHVFERQNA